MSIHHTCVVAVNVKAHSELFCMLATLVYVFVGMHGKLSYFDLQRSPWTFALHPWGLHVGGLFWQWLGETPLNQEISFFWIHIPFWELTVFKFTFTENYSTLFSRSWNLYSNQRMLRWCTVGVLPVFHCWRRGQSGHLHQDGQLGRQILLSTFWSGTY